MKTLIITVGTRQIGWRCQDQVIRCFGADGDRSAPNHIDQLYQELGVQRGYHQPDALDSRCSVRDLGERYYEHCQHWLGDFSAVELLLDHKIVAEQVPHGLNHIILWGSDQPDTVSWFHRRLDTLWLAKLMAGKIKETWSEVKTHVLTPVVVANNREAIREELEGFILPYALQTQPAIEDEQFTLMIENIGATPAIAESLEICAAALVRQYQVLNVIPEAPQPLYQLLNGAQSSQFAQSYQTVFIGEYFWSLERTRVISAWERGDFKEAEIWLKAHRNRHLTLYRLAGYLALATNWQISNALKDIRANWLGSKALTQLASPEKLQNWQEHINRILPINSNQPTIENRIVLAWESCLLIELPLYRGNFTSAFIQFAQTLERLLYLYYKTGKWVTNGYVTPPDNLRNRGDDYNPSLRELLLGWYKLRRLNSTDKWYQLLERIREKRNQVVHDAESISLQQLLSIWTGGGLFPVKVRDDPNEIWKLMLNVLEKVCNPSWQIPKQPLLRSLHEWGLNLLRSELASASCLFASRK